jgi:hypothetical protein
MNAASESAWSNNLSDDYDPAMRLAARAAPTGCLLSVAGLIEAVAEHTPDARLPGEISDAELALS